MDIKAFLIVLLTVLTVSCSTTELLSGGRHFPNTPRFTIEPGPREMYVESGINFNAIYYLDMEEFMPPGAKSISYNYYRFWPDGRMLITFQKGFPTHADAESFERAYVGYYTVNSNHIAMEYFVPNTAKSRWDYFRVNGKILSDSILTWAVDSDEQGTDPLSFLLYTFDAPLERNADW